MIARTDVPFPIKKDYKFTFVDLFSGIGGFHLAAHQLGGKCVFASEIDSKARYVYYKNFGIQPEGDITKIDAATIPTCNILTAGFPCQSFSQAGKRMGFEDTRGTMFFEIARIVKETKPDAIFLENVKGLSVHDKGKTLTTIINVLKNDLGYLVPSVQIVNAIHFNVPQNRERIFIVAFKNQEHYDKYFLHKVTYKTTAISDILENEPVESKYYVSKRYWETLKAHKERHRSKRHGFGYEIIPEDGIANTLMCGGMGRERNLIVDERIRKESSTILDDLSINEDCVRRMTPREWARLQGFPDNFILHNLYGANYKLLGNSVCVPAVKYTMSRILSALDIR